MAAPERMADWAEFDPREYLNEYYSDLGGENVALLRFFVEAYRTVTPNGLLLDFGGGPTIYPLIAAANAVREIHFSDYLDANLDEVRSWLRGDAAAFDWSPFVAKTLELEAGTRCSNAEVARREHAIRARVTQVMRCDASRLPPIRDRAKRYDVVVSNFCAESATSDPEVWRAFVRNIGSLLKPEGKFIVSALRGATRYSVGSKLFPAVHIEEEDLAEALTDSGFPAKHLEIHSTPADRSSRLYAGVMLAIATKAPGSGRSESSDD